MASAEVDGLVWWLAWKEADLEHWYLIAVQKDRVI